MRISKITMILMMRRGMMTLRTRKMQMILGRFAKMKRKN